MSNAKKQLLEHLKHTIEIGNRIIIDSNIDEAALDSFHIKLEELIEYSRASKMNFLIARKIEDIELFQESKDYDGKLNQILKKILPPNKKAEKKKNLNNYIKKQNLILAAISYYFKHET
jgi:hypothetical protein